MCQVVARDTWLNPVSAAPLLQAPDGVAAAQTLLGTSGSAVQFLPSQQVPSAAMNHPGQAAAQRAYSDHLLCNGWHADTPGACACLRPPAQLKFQEVSCISQGKADSSPRRAC